MPTAPWRLVTLVAALATLLTSGYFVVQAREQAQVRAASRAGARGDLSVAAHEATQVRRQPASAEARRVRAYALAGLGRDRAAARAFAVALRDRPSDWHLERDLATVLLRSGRRRAARTAMARALALNPRMVLPPGFAAR